MTGVREVSSSGFGGRGRKPSVAVEEKRFASCTGRKVEASDRGNKDGRARRRMNGFIVEIMGRKGDLRKEGGDGEQR